MIEVSEVFFLLLLWGIRCWSCVTLDKVSPCPEKTETLKLSSKISISESFYILVLLLDKLVLGIDLDLSAVFSVSIIWVDLDLYIDLTLSFLLLLGVSTFLLGDFGFSFFVDCVNLIFCWNMRIDVFLHYIFLFPFFCLPCQYSFLW